MPIRIRQLVADVVVQRHCGCDDESPTAAGSPPAIPTAEALASVDNAIAQPALHLPEVGGSAVDPRQLADRVYRLMRAEMAVARERA